MWMWNYCEKNQKCEDCILFLEILHTHTHTHTPIYFISKSAEDAADGAGTTPRPRRAGVWP